MPKYQPTVQLILLKKLSMVYSRVNYLPFPFRKQNKARCVKTFSQNNINFLYFSLRELSIKLYKGKYAINTKTLTHCTKTDFPHPSYSWNKIRKHQKFRKTLSLVSLNNNRPNQFSGSM